MQSTVTIRDYPCGSGKTTSMIESFHSDRKYLVIVPLLPEFDRVVEWSKLTPFQQPHANDNQLEEAFRKKAAELIIIKDIPALSRLSLSHSGQLAGMPNSNYCRTVVNALKNL